MVETLNIMSRDKRYQHLLNDKRWKQVKEIVWRRTNGLCERCMQEGIITQGVDCHHIRPVEGATSLYGPDGMEARCYDPANIQLLCVACHIKTHAEMRSHTKESVEANKKRKRQRFMELNDPNYVQPYGEKADDYLRNLEERARMEETAKPTD